MKQTFAIIELTFREAFARKIFMAFLGISTLVCLLFIFALNLDIVDGFQASVSFFGQKSGQLAQVADILHTLESIIAIGLFTGGLFLSLFATSNLIPGILQPGTIDLLISKPLSRAQILLGRYLGAVAIVAFNIFYLVLFSWLILSIKTGLWNFGFLASSLLIIATFAVFYGLMTLLALISRSGAFALMGTYFVLFFSPVLLQREQIYALLSHKFYGLILDGLYYFLPKSPELGKITSDLVLGAPVESWMPLWSSLIFGNFMLGISLFIFKKKNF